MEIKVDDEVFWGFMGDRESRMILGRGVVRFIKETVESWEYNIVAPEPSTADPFNTGCSVIVPKKGGRQCFDGVLIAKDAQVLKDKMVKIAVMEVNAAVKNITERQL